MNIPDKYYYCDTLKVEDDTVRCKPHEFWEAKDLCETLFGKVDGFTIRGGKKKYHFLSCPDGTVGWYYAFVQHAEGLGNRRRVDPTWELFIHPKEDEQVNAEIHQDQ